MRFFVLASVRADGGHGCGFDQLDFAGKGAEGIGQHAGHFIETFDIGRARVDGSPVLDFTQHGICIDCVEKGLRGTVRFHRQLP